METNDHNKFQIISYPRFKELHRNIQRCQQYSKELYEPQCMCLEGESGAGKSTLVREYVKQFGERIITEDGVRIPIFYSQLPSPAKVKGTASSLLEQLGDPGFNRGTLQSMTSRLVGLIKTCGVELVILDEFSHLIEPDSVKVLASVSEWLKMLIKLTGVPFLVIGVTGTILPILKRNNQLFRLFSCIKTLEPFKWDDEVSRNEFSNFLQFAEVSVNFKLDPELPKKELFFRISYATDGLVGHIMNLLCFATGYCREKGKNYIGMNELSLAFDERLKAYMGRKVNPFRQDIHTKFYPPLSDTTPKIMSMQETNHLLCAR